MKHIEAWARFTVRPPDRTPPWRWAESNVEIDASSPFPGKYSSDMTPWTKEPMERAADNRIRRITILCAAQTGKTQMCLIILLFWIATDPGPIQWVMAAQDEAKTFSNKRLTPGLETCKPVADLMPKVRSKKKTLEIGFAESPLLITGSNSKSKLQGNPIRYLILDEVRNYKDKSAVGTALKRTTSFWNAREFIVSTGDEEGDEVDRSFKDGSQGHYYVPCLACSQQFEFKLDQLKWDTNEETCPGGEYDFAKLRQTVRHECPGCKRLMVDDFGERMKMALRGAFVHVNPKAPADHVSYTWSALLVPWIPWHRIVQEFLLAKRALAQGIVEPFKTFVTETLGETWKEDWAYSADITLGEYTLGSPWEEEFRRFMTVDKQKDHYWYVIRQWAKSGASRLTAYGRLDTVADIEAIAEQYKIHERGVLVDAGFEQNEVAQMCCAHGWVAMKGDQRESFITHEEGSKIRGLRPYTWPPLAIDPGIGTTEQGRQRCPLFIWSNPTVKDFLYRLKTGKGLPFGVAADVTQEYIRQLSSETKKRLVNKKTNRQEWMWVQLKGRPNHLWDCECMQVVAAMVSGILPNPFTRPITPDPEKEKPSDEASSAPE